MEKNPERVLPEHLSAVALDVLVQDPGHFKSYYDRRTMPPKTLSKRLGRKPLRISQAIPDRRVRRQSYRACDVSDQSP